MCQPESTSAEWECLALLVPRFGPETKLPPVFMGCRQGQVSTGPHHRLLLVLE
jgi:hypothetical protein